MSSIKKIAVSRVISVFDGDTFRVDIDSWPRFFGHKIPVRIRGIDAPERRNADGTESLEALKARDWLKTRLMNAKIVTLENLERCKYFRLIADVFVDGHDIAAEILRLGLAEPYKKTKSKKERCITCEIL